MRYEAPRLNLQASAKMLILANHTGSDKPGTTCYDSGGTKRSSNGAYELDE